MKKLSVHEFAKLAGVSEHTVYRWVRSELITPEITFLGVKKIMKIPESEIAKIKARQ